MAERPQDPVSELMGQLEAAGQLIDSLEEEVVQLRADLEDANVALKVAREEVTARGQALEDRDESEVSEDETNRLREEISDLRRAHADEQIQLRNDHINELAELRRSLEEQRREDIAAASSDERVEALTEELRRERDTLEERHRADIETLETSGKEWEERLREEYRAQENQHLEEMERLTQEHDEVLRALRNSLETEFTRNLEESRKADSERHERTLAALRSASEGRETELQENYRSVVERQQSEIDSLRTEVLDLNRRTEEIRREGAREVKEVAENREREIKRTHAARLTEVNRDSSRKIKALQAQKEADNRALLARHAEELAMTRREYEERLYAEDERRKQETWGLEERLKELGIQRETELRVYTTRLRDLEELRLASEVALADRVDRTTTGLSKEVAALAERLERAEAALKESESLRSRLESNLQYVRSRAELGVRPREETEAEAAPLPEEAGTRTEELDARRILAEERVMTLEARLEEAERQNQRSAKELSEALRELERISDPERRLRDGIALFNTSEHARAVASISRALGLPKVNVEIGDGDPGKPILTFVWEEMAWRSYVSDPTEGVEEPRVYLSGTGDDPKDLPDAKRRPNARMDSRGRLMLGVQAR